MKCNDKIVKKNWGTKFYVARELIEPSTRRTNYFEKVCLQAPACEKAWIYERIPGYEIEGFDDR